MPTPGHKGVMSARLLSMKFMQRTAVDISPSSTGSTPSGPPAKRARLNDDSPLPYSPVPSRSPYSASAPEERQKQSIVEKQAAEAGETRWVLNIKQQKPVTVAGFSVVQTGWAEIDAVEESDKGETVTESETRTFTGRIKFGRVPLDNTNPAGDQVNNHQAKTQSWNNKTDESSLELDKSSSDDDPDKEYDPTEELIKQERRAAAARARAKRSANAEVAEASVGFTPERRKREVNLNKLTSISGGQRKDPRGYFTHSTPVTVLQEPNHQEHVKRNFSGHMVYRLHYGPGPQFNRGRVSGFPQR